MKIKWQPIVKFEAPVLFQWYVFEGHKKKYFRSSLGLNIGLANERIVLGEISIDLNEWIALEKLLATKIKKKLFLQKFIGDCYRCADTLLKTSKKIGKSASLSPLENRQLNRFYKKYQRSVLQFVPFLNSLLALDRVLKNEIAAVIENELGLKDKSKQDLLISHLIVPKKKSHFAQEAESLLKIALKIQKKKEINIDQEIKKHLEKFAWTSSIAYRGNFQTESEVKEKIEELLKEDPGARYKKVIQVKKETRGNYQKAFNQVCQSKKITELIELSRELLYLLTYRLDVFSIAHYHIFSLLREISGKLGLTPEELMFLTGDEIVNFLKESEKPDRVTVKARMKGYALIKQRGKFSLLVGDQIKQAVGKPKIKEDFVKGAIASQGRAVGRAKTLQHVEEMNKIERGNIIVSPMTRPDLMPAISRAAGIITDFGGMLCHAAIVSREFGIPCIVGTKIATKVFKDGDLVELNAYEGIARKLE